MPFINFVQIADDVRLDVPALVSWRYAGTPARMGSWELVASLQLGIESEYYVSDDRVEFRGSRGIIWVNRCAGKLLDEPPLVLYRDGEVRAFHRVDADWATSFRRGTHEFIDAILEGRPARLTADEGRATLAFALAGQISAAEHREVTIAELR